MKSITILIALFLSVSVTAQVKLEYGDRYKTNYISDPERLIKLSDDRFMLIRGSRNVLRAFAKREGDCFELFDSQLKRLRMADFPDKHGDANVHFQFVHLVKDRVWAFFAQNGEGKTIELWAWELDSETLLTKGNAIKLSEWEGNIKLGEAYQMGEWVKQSPDGSKVLVLRRPKDAHFLTIYDSGMKAIKDQSFQWARKGSFPKSVELADNGDIYIIEGGFTKKQTATDEREFWFDFIPFGATEVQRVPILSSQEKYFRDIKIGFNIDNSASITGFYGSDKGPNYAVGVFKSDFKEGKLTEPVLSKIPVAMLSLTRPEDKRQPREGKSYENETFRNIRYIAQKNGELLMVCQNEIHSISTNGKDPVTTHGSFWFFYFNQDGKVAWNDWMEKSQIQYNAIRGIGLFMIPEGENLHILFNECSSNGYKSLNDAFVTKAGKIDNKVVQEIGRQAVGISGGQKHVFVSAGFLLDGRTLIAPFEEERNGGLVKISLE